MKRALGATITYSRPAISPIESVHSKIVVVPAQQAQQEREKAAQAVVRPPHVSKVSLNGKVAFEALFNDGGNASKTTKK